RQAYAEADDHFRQQRYAEAADAYRTAANRWPDSILEEDAMFMRAEALFFSDQYPKASDLYGELMKKYENSRYLDRITARQFQIARYWEEYQGAGYVPNFTDHTRPI